MSDRYLDTARGRAELDAHITREPDERGFTTGDGWVSTELPEDAGVIQEVRDGYGVSLGGQFLGSYQERDAAETALLDGMDEAGFWPDCFYVNERGNVDQLIPS